MLGLGPPEDSVDAGERGGLREDMVSRRCRAAAPAYWAAELSAVSRAKGGRAGEFGPELAGDTTLTFSETEIQLSALGVTLRPRAARDDVDSVRECCPDDKPVSGRSGIAGDFGG